MLFKVFLAVILIDNPSKCYTHLLFMQEMHNYKLFESFLTEHVNRHVFGCANAMDVKHVC